MVSHVGLEAPRRATIPTRATAHRQTHTKRCARHDGLVDAEEATEDSEAFLTGGVMAGATLIQGTVRRRPPDHAETVRALWKHLRSNGFQAVPKFLGHDENGREMLTLIPGRAGFAPLTAEIASDEALVSAAALIRRFHDATVGFDMRVKWTETHRDPANSDEVVCHNDLAPFNLVYDTQSVVGIIDWDLCAPGRRLWDLAYAAWRLVPLHRPEYLQYVGWPGADPDRARRLRLFVDTYGLESRHELLSAVRERQVLNTAFFEKLIADGLAVSSDHPGEAGDIDYLFAHWDEWDRALA